MATKKLTLQEALDLYFDAGDMTKAQLLSLGERLGVAVHKKDLRESILRHLRWELGDIIKEGRRQVCREKVRAAARSQETPSC